MKENTSLRGLDLGAVNVRYGRGVVSRREVGGFTCCRVAFNWKYRDNVPCNIGAIFERGNSTEALPYLFSPLFSSPLLSPPLLSSHPLSSPLFSSPLFPSFLLSSPLFSHKPLLSSPLLSSPLFSSLLIPSVLLSSPLLSFPFLPFPPPPLVQSQLPIRERGKLAAPLIPHNCTVLLPCREYSNNGRT